MSRIKTIFNLQGQFVPDPAPAATIEIMSRYTMGCWHSQLEVLPPGTYEPPQDWSHYTDMTDAIKAINPDFKAAMYFSGAAYQRQWEPGYPALADAELFHQPDGSILMYDDGLPGPPPAASRFRWWRMIDEGVRARLLAYMLDFLETTHLDGLFIDGWSPGFYATLIRTAPPGGHFGLTGGIQEGPAHLAVYWADAMVAWTDELTTALEDRGYHVWLNGIGMTPGFDADDPDQVFLGNGQLATADYGSGFMFEHGHRAYGNVDFFTEILSLFSQGLARGLDARPGGRMGWLQCFPLLFTATDPVSPPAYVQGLDLARFYLACYLLVQTEQSIFAYYQLNAFDPNGDTDANDDIHWSADWDKDHGSPTGRQFSSFPETIRWREYTRGYAVVNPTSTTKYFKQTGSFRIWDPEDGLLVRIDESDATTHAILAPYSGYFFWSLT